MVSLAAKEMWYLGEGKILQTIAKKILRSRSRDIGLYKSDSDEQLDIEIWFKLILVHISHILPKKCFKTRY